MSALRISDGEVRRTKKRRKSVAFRDENEIINPEDVDPTVGKFRNLIQTAVIPKRQKKARFEAFRNDSSQPGPIGPCPSDHQFESSNSSDNSRSESLAVCSTLLGKFSMPNPAPDVEFDSLGPSLPSTITTTTTPAFVLNSNSLYADTSLSLTDFTSIENSADHHSKKKYAKEAWPGRKTSSSSMFPH